MAIGDRSKLPTGLLLTGGGARAAYQVGVLEAVAGIRRDCLANPGENPFPIITGTSAGAINAAALACAADDFDAGVGRMVDVWHNFHAQQVYRADSLGVLRTGASWLTLLSVGWLLARWRRLKPRSLLDNTPLLELLRSMVPLQRLPDLVAKGHVQALAVTASSYTSGEHVTFFEGAPELAPWVRSQRFAVRDRISHQHLLASSAIPFVFPATALQVNGRTEFFGDGSMRQSAPVAAAIHLGAQRILVVGAGRMAEPRDDSRLAPAATYPSLAQIAGHTLSNIFLDALAVDVERVRRINHTIGLVPPQARQNSSLRPVDLLLIAPSQRIDSIAARHVRELPAPIRTLLGGVGVTSDRGDVKGAVLASYLLFEPGFTRELMALGRADVQRQRAEVCAFFGWLDPKAATEQNVAGPGSVPFPDRRRDPLRIT
jgi:NTE family protein